MIELDLATRRDRYRQTIEKIVCTVGEHQLYELKRSCTMGDLYSKIELVRDIQAIATSRIEVEKFLVIGADASTKSFVPAENINDFDEAVIRQMLEKYLIPVPAFELFCMETSEGHPFVLFVFSKQKSRRILARVTVEDKNDRKPRLLLRKGDLWTKGTSTGKRLATPEDWDEIYEDVIETEAEERTRRRTAHVIEQALAHEKLRTGYGLASLPAYFSDEEFRSLLESLCISKDSTRFQVLLERIRDDVVEGWHSIGAYDRLESLSDLSQAIPKMPEQVRDHKKIVFLPAMERLTLAGLLVVKQAGPPEFLEAIVSLLKEVHDTTHRLEALQQSSPHGAVSNTSEEHLSHTIPAIESLISLHLIGAYVALRDRFRYLPHLFKAMVYRAGKSLYEHEDKLAPMVFWPLSLGWGEPKTLTNRAGRINLCLDRIQRDPVYRRFFGSPSFAQKALVQYEFCLELNSSVAVSNLWQKAKDYVGQRYPKINFEFWPSLVAFDLDPIMDIAEKLYEEISERKTKRLQVILFDITLSNILAQEGPGLFIGFLRELASMQEKLFLSMNRFPPIVPWPKKLAEALKGAQS